MAAVIQTPGELLRAMTYVKRVVLLSRPMYDAMIFHRLDSTDCYGNWSGHLIPAVVFATALLRGFIVEDIADGQISWVIAQGGRDYLDAQRVAQELEGTQHG